MNRPRNRQARPLRNNTKNDNRNNRSTRSTAAPASSDVPSAVQVIPGASVSIVQKADQATGREICGLVKDVLTRGDHPRGIKVRLQDGRIGRVQRMASTNESASVEAQPTTGSSTAYTSLDESKSIQLSDQHDAENRSPTLGDYVISRKNKKTRSPLTKDSSLSQSPVVARCPICQDFEGDEAAVSYHVQEHLEEEKRSPSR